jgi:hypothetical protein
MPSLKVPFDPAFSKLIKEAMNPSIMHIIPMLIERFKYSAVVKKLNEALCFLSNKAGSKIQPVSFQQARGGKINV